MNCSLPRPAPRPSIFLQLTVALLLVGLQMLSPVPLRAEPQVSDKAMARQLLGKHALTLQWLGSGTLRDAGQVEVGDDSGTWRLAGRQDAKEGYVTLDGMVTAIDATSFAFTGKIVTNVSYINQGRDCVREGDFTFAKKGSRKYWRLQQIDNPCDQAADYVDIYLR